MKQRRTILRWSPGTGGRAGGILLLLLLTVNESLAGPIELSPQMITLPVNAGEPLMVDIDGDGRSDLLVIDPVANQLLNYHQRSNGFTNIPDRILSLPPQTAWVAPCDVDSHPGLELLMSTPTGLVYLRQNGGWFASERHVLIETNQTFTPGDFPILTLLATNKAGTADFIPVISNGQTMLYHRSDAYHWNPGPVMALDAEGTGWAVNQRWPNGDFWTLGPKAAQSWRISQSFDTKSDQKEDANPESEAVRRLINSLKADSPSNPPMTDRLDVNGDGRTDLVVWQVSQKLEFKTDIYVFLRGADQQLPERPTQILHCRGLPIPIDSEYAGSPVRDINGDGVGELVLLELKTHFLSASGLMETALSHGLDWSLTIRSFHHGAFSRLPDASVPITAILPANVVLGWPFLIDGDFNGDGRPDLLVRRSDTQWEIHCSTTDGRWFAREPTMIFDAPAQGDMEIKDLNGGGLSDIIWHEPDQHRLLIFMPPSHEVNIRKP